MLTLQSLSDINLTVRAMFTISLMLSMLCVFFTLIQQRELSTPINAQMLRVWLWDGHVRQPSSHHITGSPIEPRPGKLVRESSLTSLYVMTAPFELLRIAISVFLSAVVAYLTLIMQANIKQGTGPVWGNRGLLIAFVVCTAFPLMVFGQSLGQKDREMARCRAAERTGSVFEVATSFQRANAHD